MAAKSKGTSNPFYSAVKAKAHKYEPAALAELFLSVDKRRIEGIAGRVSEYIKNNLPAAFESRNSLADYRSNPYVLMTSAAVMNLSSAADFGSFLFNSKLYMALETSFGKQAESALVEAYPIRTAEKWGNPPEKIAEFAALNGLSREDKAKRRAVSVWREIDRACTVGDRRYLVSIKSGPNTINDTQVAGMYEAIVQHNKAWLAASRKANRAITGIDIVLGLTYGTDRTTNNKENQILVKLLDAGFVEEDRARKPGVLIDEETRSIRVYRCIGKEFWAFVGQPNSPTDASFVFLEVLLALSKALSAGIQAAELETRINMRMRQLAVALGNLTFPRNSLPDWIRDSFTEPQLFWFACAMTAFFDDGI